MADAHGSHPGFQSVVSRPYYLSRWFLADWTIILVILVFYTYYVLLVIMYQPAAIPR